MQTKTSLALAACAALAEQALALNSHRHFHRDVSGDVPAEMAVETIWTTIYEDPAATPEPVIVPATVTIPVTIIKEVMAPQTTLTPSVRPAPQETPSSSSGAALPVKNASTPVADPSPATSSTSSGGSGPEKAIAYENVDMANYFAANCPTCRRAYNWDSSPNGDLDSRLVFTPTLRTNQTADTDRFDLNMADNKKKGIKMDTIFSFNEPDRRDQANLTPKAAAEAHARHLQAYQGSHRICAPSVSNSQEPNEGVDYLRQFSIACNEVVGCSFDCCVGHFYWDLKNVGKIVDYLDALHKACNKSVILNEFGANDLTENGQFIEAAVPLLKNMTCLTEYTAFFVQAGRLMSDSNSISESGKAYIEA